MPRPDFNTLQAAEQAYSFTQSAFGKRYLERLKKVQQFHMKLAMRSDYSDSERMAALNKAAAYQDELDYFQTATAIKKNPTIIARLKATITGKEVSDKQ